MEFPQPVKVIKPTYMKTFEWESFDLPGWRRWIGQHSAISVYASVIYVLFIFTTQALMQKRKAFQLTTALTLWNAMLSIVSAAALVRVLPEFIYVISDRNGFHNIVCKWTAHNTATDFWSWILLILKFVELGDTAFIVFRKKPLIFLHWYHHILTLLGTWCMYEAYEPYQLVCIVMNSFIHSVMYAYYALKAQGVYIPKCFSMALTVMQLSQMVVGVAISIHALHLMWYQGREKECDRGYFGIKLAFAVYGSYFVLFAHFFYKAYISKRERHSANDKWAKKLK